MQMEMLGSNHDVNLRQGNTHMPLVAGFYFLAPTQLSPAATVAKRSSCTATLRQTFTQADRVYHYCWVLASRS